MNRKILIVEDSLTQAVRLKYILEQQQYIVTAANDGHHALNIVQELNPDLIISDIIMPKMDGYELCKQLRHMPQFRELSIILLTTLSETEDILKGLECGVNYLITKPYEDDYLISYVKDALQLQDIRKSEISDKNTRILLHGTEYSIAAAKTQILDLLISIYDEAVRKNQQLTQARTQLQELKNSLEAKDIF